MKNEPSTRVGVVLVLCALLGGAFCLEARAEEGGTTLANLEAELERDPDNLRNGSTYRQLVIQKAEYDRALKFFDRLVSKHANSANAHLNYGFAYVDKIPVAGSITQVLLANNALTQFTKTLELQPSWIAYYTRGNSYLFWPKIFGRTPNAIADLEETMKIQMAERKQPYHVRTYIALGDAYWKLDNLDKARKIWDEGLRQFPGNPALKARLSKQGDELKALQDETYDITKRVDTSLSELFAIQPGRGAQEK